MALTRMTVPARTILTPTGGFLQGFSHTLNPYRGCSFGNALCGVYCYASETRYGKDRAQPWGSYLYDKADAALLYRREAEQIRARGGGLRIFFSSVTDPYVPQERALGVTRALLCAMAELPPDLLVLQTHTPGPVRDVDLLTTIAARGRVVVQITTETDYDRLPGLPPHATPLSARLAALAALRATGLPTLAVVSPLLPLRDMHGFAERLGACADGVLLDHYLLGDGSKEGARTQRRRLHTERTLPEALCAEGFAEWTRLERFWEVVEIFRAVLGAARIGISQEGFQRAALDPGWPR